MSISHINYIMGMTVHSLLCFSVFNPQKLEILSKHVVQRRLTFQGISKAFYTSFCRIPFVQNTHKKDKKKNLEMGNNQYFIWMSLGCPIIINKKRKTLCPSSHAPDVQSLIVQK